MKKVLYGSICMMAFATAASAQDTVSTAAPETPGAAPQAGIDDIIITASRRAENVQRSALSIQALSGDALRNANVTKAEDLSSVATGVQIGTGGAFAQAYIRGVGNYATQAYAESAVAFNLDGVYISRTWATRGMFYDLERVEVLKGPQGTLYGRNASGGAINVITAKPKLGQVSGFVEGQLGNYELRQGIAALNLPLSETLAVRASGQIVDRDGYLTDGYDDESTQAGRLQLLWKPNSDISLLVSGQYQHAGGNGAGSILTPQLPGNKFRGSADPAVQAITLSEPGTGSLLTYPLDDGYLDATIYSLSAELNWDMGFAMLTVLPAYRDSKLHILGYLPSFAVWNDEHNRQTSVEVRLGNDGERLKWVLGAFYFNELTDPAPSGGRDFLVNQGINAVLSEDIDLRTRSYAIFGQATFSVTDALRLTGGLRYTYERKIHREALVGYSFPHPGCFDPSSPVPPLFCRTDIPIDARETFNSVTYKAGFEYDLAPHSMAYASISSGFKSGGFYQAPPPNTFKPEKLQAFEAGIKNRFLDNTLQVNIEAFYWKYTDHQESYTGPTTLPGFYTFLTVNAGQAKSHGADLDTVYRPTPADELSLKVQFNKTKYDEFQFPYLTGAFGPPVTGCAVGPLTNGVQTIDCAGKPLVRAPKWTGTAGYNHTFDLDAAGKLVAAADVQFGSASYLSTDFLSEGRQKSFAVVGANLTYASSNDRLEVTGYVRNIFDTVVRTQAFRSPFITPANPLVGPQGAILATVRPPRTYGVRVRYNF